MPVTVDGECR